MTTIRHGGPCGLRIEMKAAETPEIGSFFMPQWSIIFAPRSEGGVGRGLIEKCGEAAFLYLPHLVVLMHGESSGHANDAGK